MIQNSLIFQVLLDSLTLLHQLHFRLVSDMDQHENKNYDFRHRPNIKLHSLPL